MELVQDSVFSEAFQDPNVHQWFDYMQPEYLVAYTDVLTAARWANLRRVEDKPSGIKCLRHGEFRCKLCAEANNCRHYLIDENYTISNDPKNMCFERMSREKEEIPALRCGKMCCFEKNEDRYGFSKYSWEDWLVRDVDALCRGYQKISAIYPELNDLVSEKYMANANLMDRPFSSCEGSNHPRAYLMRFLSDWDRIHAKWRLRLDSPDGTAAYAYIGVRSIEVILRLLILFSLYFMLKPVLTGLFNRTPWGFSRYKKWWTKRVEDEWIGKLHAVYNMDRSLNRNLYDMRVALIVGKMKAEYLEMCSALNIESDWEGELVKIVCELVSRYGDEMQKSAYSIKIQGGFKYGTEAPIVKAAEQNVDVAAEFIAKATKENNNSRPKGKFPIVTEMIRKNGFKIVYRGARASGTQYGLFIYSRFALVTEHLLEDMERSQAQSFTIERDAPVGLKNTIFIELSDIKRKGSPIPGFEILELPASKVTDAKDIRKHVLSKDDFSKVMLNEVALIEPRPGKISSYIQQAKLRKPGVHKMLSLEGNEVNSKLEVELYYEYSTGGRGLCGSPLVAEANGEKIVGFHIAGVGTSRGYAVPVFRELLTVAEPVDFVMEETGLDLTDEQGLISYNGNCEFIGSGDRRQFPNHAVKTRLEASLFQEEFPCTTCPAPLTNSDPRLPVVEGVPASPLKYGCEKAMVIPTCFVSEDLRASVELVYQNIVSTSQPVLENAQELLDDQVNFAGIANNKYYTGLTLDTSEGFPLVKERPVHIEGKRWLFEYFEDEGGKHLIDLHQKLKNHIARKQQMRENRIVPVSYFTSCLKDCKIPIAKLVKPGCTRVFSISDVEFTWSFRKFFGHFPPALHAARIENGICVGINPDCEWFAVYQKLNEVGNEDVVTGDYKAFGDRLEKKVAYLCLQMISRWYEHYFGTQYSEIREMMILELLHAPRISFNSVYRVHSGIPSGFPFTVEINSMVNLVYMAYLYRRLLPERPLIAFNRNVRVLTYGDDLIMSVRVCDQDRFNFTTIKQELANHEIEFTDSSKGAEEERPFISIWSATFLKRGFKRHPSRRLTLLAPLPEDVVFDSLCWVNRLSTDKERELFVTARAALNLAYTRGEDFYETLAGRLRRFFAEKLRRNFDTYTWFEVDRRVFESDYWLVAIGKD